jgi:hypothetical protein
MNLRPFVGPPTSKRSQRGIAATESAMKLLPALKVGDNPFLFAGEYSGLIHPEQIVDTQTGCRSPSRSGRDAPSRIRHFFAWQLIANETQPSYATRWRTPA